MSEQEIRTVNDEIVYQINNRKLSNVVWDDISPNALLLILSFIILKSGSQSIFMVLVAMLFLVISTYCLLISLAFKKLTIYKDKVAVDKFIFGESIIDIKDIEKVHIGGFATLNILNFEHKNKHLSSIKYFITALSSEQVNTIEQTIKNLQAGDQTIQRVNDEILYQINRRNPFNIFLGDICPSMLLMILSYAIFKSNETNIFMVFLGISLACIGIYFLLESMTFRKLIIYKDRVVIDKLFFGRSTINVEDIKRIDIGGYVTMSILDFVHKNKHLLGVKYSITALSAEQTSKIEQTIKTLKTGEMK